MCSALYFILGIPLLVRQHLYVPEYTQTCMLYLLKQQGWSNVIIILRILMNYGDNMSGNMEYMNIIVIWGLYLF